MSGFELHRSVKEEPPPSPPPPSPQFTQPIPVSATSHVNGQGLWRSWQRSFRHSLDALLDLLDNAIDASHGHGRIRISSSTPNRDDDASFLLLNSYCSSAYKEMYKILEVFSSQKEQQAIGENGVGVKQASAMLSNFSVVVTKKSTRFQVGILCLSLQRPDGIHIPSYTFEGDWEQELDNICENDSIFSLCMEYLGGKPVPTDSNDELDRTNDVFQQAGRDRLMDLMSHMSDSNEWKEFECVFGLLLDQLRFPESVKPVLNELAETLPRTYLHLQAHQCDMKIDKKPLKFQYWERRLVELTCFPIKVSRTVSLENEDKDSITDPKTNANQLRVFVGFDPHRPTCATFYVYSRECGRLVKHVPDARNELNLSAGGTQFCQGLTVILDDFESSLPLTPTKQDIAWSDGQQGDIHRSNVTKWVGAVARTYYNHHLEYFGGKKGSLNDEVKSHAKAAKSLHETTDFITPLSEHLFFNAFAGLEWSKLGDGGIKTKNKKSVFIVYGSATLLPFNRVENKYSSPTKSSAKKLPPSSVAKKHSRASPFFADLDEAATTRNPKRTRKSVSYSDAPQDTLVFQRKDLSSDAEGTDLDMEEEPIVSASPRSRRLQAKLIDASRQHVGVNNNSRTGQLEREVAELKQTLQDKDEEIAALQSEKDALELQLRRKHGMRAEPADLERLEVLQQQLKDRDVAIQNMELSTKQKLQEMDAKLEELKRQHSIEIKQLEATSAKTLESLRRRNQHLEIENQGMKDELDRKNEQLLVMEEELEC